MARLSFYKLVYRKDYIKMVKSEYIIKSLVDNEYDPMLLELESIGSGNTIFIEVNKSTITISSELQLHMINAYFDTQDVSKVDIDNSDKVFREAMRHYLSIGDEFELHAIVEFDDDGYTLLDIIAG